MGLFSKKSPAKPDATTATSAGSTNASAGNVLDVLRATVSHISRDHIPAQDLDIRAHLLDSGYVDSLSATELLAEIERRYHVRIGEMDLVGRLCNLEALVREIEARTGGGAG
jgi:acyl carrier protein